MLALCFNVNRFDESCGMWRRICPSLRRIDAIRYQTLRYLNIHEFQVRRSTSCPTVNVVSGRGVDARVWNQRAAGNSCHITGRAGQRRVQNERQSERSTSHSFAEMVLHDEGELLY